MHLNSNSDNLFISHESYALWEAVLLIQLETDEKQTLSINRPI